MLKGLADVTRLDAGVIVPDLRIIDIAALVQRVGDEFSAEAVDLNIRLIVESLSAPVRTDPLILIRVLRNLVSNALKFTEQGGIVHLGVAEAENGTLKMLVEDTGCGIAPDKLHQVFDEYVQLGNHERDHKKGLGLGLGLAIVQRLVRLLDLDLTFTSQPGIGTTVSLTLERANGTPMPLEGVDESWLRHTTPIGNLCVLLVGSEDTIRAGMTTVLTSWGCQVYSAQSTNGAIDILNQTGATPHVLLVNQRLSDSETGLQVTERVRDEINDVPTMLHISSVRYISPASTVSIAVRKMMDGVDLPRKPRAPMLRTVSTGGMVSMPEMIRTGVVTRRALSACKKATPFVSSMTRSHRMRSNCDPASIRRSASRGELKPSQS